MTARVTLWQKRSEVTNLDRPVVAFHITVEEDNTRVTLILNGQEIDYSLISGDEMQVGTNTGKHSV